MENPIFTKEFNQGTFSVHKEPISSSLNFFNVKQVHGNHIIKVLPQHSPEDLQTIEADALIVLYDEYSPSNLPSLAIKTADCLPLLLLGEKGYALFHLGWRGIFQKLFLKVEVFSINPNSIFIGPSIQQCCFSVQEDFRRSFRDSPHFKFQENKMFFDLQGELKDQIRREFPQIPIENSKICTCCCTEYFSYRRNHTALRNYNIFSPIRDCLGKRE